MIALESISALLGLSVAMALPILLGIVFVFGLLFGGLISGIVHNYKALKEARRLSDHLITLKQNENKEIKK